MDCIYLVNRALVSFSLFRFLFGIGVIPYHFLRNILKPEFHTDWVVIGWINAVIAIPPDFDFRWNNVPFQY
jgi:hypothetical protein